MRHDDPWHRLEQDMAASHVAPGNDEPAIGKAWDQYPDDWTDAQVEAFNAAHPRRPGDFPCFPGACRNPEQHAALTSAARQLPRRHPNED